ncbi:hypothetical protein GCM10017668_27410 [Streptomyces tuirus]|uniref:Uncharacterized protein n=1 Tax=Streptomyces tuirus TaxID=68278 RepID=A0A7G1NCL0_9ACTN|nr:hypothetical protein GCM10017668_27410 [Streptomyces tuirus]
MEGGRWVGVRRKGEGLRDLAPPAAPCRVRREHRPPRDLLRSPYKAPPSSKAAVQ